MDPNSDDSPYGDLIQPTPGEEEPGTDPLRAIVARAGRRRRNALAGVAVAALLAGGAGGYVVAGNGGRTTGPSTEAAASPSTTQPGAGGAASAGGAMISSPPASPTLPPLSNFKLTHLFTRTVGSITLRGFESQPFAESLEPACVSPSQFRAEVSTPVMVGALDTFSFGRNNSAISSVNPGVVGEPEGDPVLVVIASTGPGVASVTAQFADNTSDTMSPAKGWVTLATPLTPALSSLFNAMPQKTLGTLTAIDANGKKLATTGINIQNAGPGARCGTAKCPPTTPTTINSPPAGGPPLVSPAIACALIIPPNHSVGPPMTVLPGCKLPGSTPAGMMYACAGGGSASGGSGSSGTASSGTVSGGSVSGSSGSSGTASSGTATPAG